MGSRGAVRQRRDDGRWYVDFGPRRRVWSLYEDGERIPLDENLANRLLEAIRSRASDVGLDAALAHYLPAESEQNRVLVRLGAWLDAKRREKAAGDRSPTYVRELERYARPGGEFSWWAGQSVHGITFGQLEDWSYWLADRGLGAKSRRNVLGAFRAFLGWLHQRGEIREMPRRFPWPKVSERAPRVLSAEAQAAVLGRVAEDERGVFYALALMGLRPGEARALEARDYRDGWLLVDKAAKGAAASAPVRGTKSGRAKRLPVPRVLREWIESRSSPGERLSDRPLFANPRTGRAWSHWALRDRWVAAARAAGLEGVGLYEGTKHSFATDAAARGVPERSLQAFLGHRDVRSTRRYAQMADGALLDVLPAEPAEKVARKRRKARSGSATTRKR